MAKIKEKHNVRDSEVQGRHRDEWMNTETITVLEKTPLHLEQMLWSMIMHITFFCNEESIICRLLRKITICE